MNPPPTRASKRKDSATSRRPPRSSPRSSTRSSGSAAPIPGSSSRPAAVAISSRACSTGFPTEPLARSSASRSSPSTPRSRSLGLALGSTGRLARRDRRPVPGRPRPRPPLAVERPLARRRQPPLGDDRRARGFGRVERAGSVERPEGRLRGIDARTGESNFDISEAIWLKLIRELAPERPTIALLCKSAVARAVLQGRSTAADLPITRATLWRVDARRWFRASVDACLLRVEVGPGPRATEAEVFADLSALEPESSTRPRRLRPADRRRRRLSRSPSPTARRPSTGGRGSSTTPAPSWS